MRYVPFLAFIAVPLLELVILIKLGEIIGAWATILVVIATAFIGVSLLKRQGLAALGRARETVEAGDFPVESVVDGACLLVAGAFLLTPGLLTDTAGFSLLVPGIRRALARWLFNKFSISSHVTGGGFDADAGRAPHQDSANASPGPVIEGEYEDIDEPAPERHKGAADGQKSKPSPWRK